MSNCVVHTTWGFVGAAASELGVAVIILPKRRAASIQQQLNRHVTHDSPKATTYAREAAELLQLYFARNKVNFDIPIDLSNVPSAQQRILMELRNISYGATTSYGKIANAAGKPGAARFAGQTLASNPTPLLLPCHRVIRTDGTLGGFSGGTTMKFQLLALEGALLSEGAC